MEVRIVQFPQTRVAVLEHRGSPALEHVTVRKFIEWRLANGLGRDQHRTYGIHYDDPERTPAAAYRMDIGISVDAEVPANTYGVVNKVIPACRCALVRHFGSRHYVAPAARIHAEWLPRSGERLGDFPMFFHYVNVGPDVREHEMITDVYVPLA